jgi:hypothetical protein
MGYLININGVEAFSTGLLKGVVFFFDRKGSIEYIRIILYVDMAEQAIQNKQY